VSTGGGTQAALYRPGGTRAMFPLNGRIPIRFHPLLLAGLLIFTGGKEAEKGPALFRVVELGADAAFGDTGPAVALITGQAGFSSFYAALHANREPAPDPPAVDFGAEACVYISFGRQRTAGYSIDHLDVRVSHGVLVIRAQLLKPPRGSFLTQAITEPYVLLAVPAENETGGGYSRVELRDDKGEPLASTALRVRNR
jgi:hypothetical protein